MTKPGGLFLVAAIAVGIIPYARSLSAPAVPPGVSADHWIAMGDAG